MSENENIANILRMLRKNDERLSLTEVKEVPRTAYGPANPSSWPIGVPFFRTDLGWWIYYDGTRWLTENEESINAPQTSFAANGNILMAPIRTDWIPYVTRFAVGLNAAAPSNGSNYWSWFLRAVDASYVGATNLITSNTSAQTAATWYLGDGALGTVLTALNRFGFDFVAGKTGAPGDLLWSATVYYRLIIT